METGKYYLTKEEQLQREKWDWYSILKTAEMEGRKKETIRIARNMKAMGVNIDYISKITELPIEEVRRIKCEK